jgi:hypothetical protein
MIISGDRQHPFRINDPNHLEHVMSLDTERPRARTRKRTTDIQRVARYVEFRTEMTTEMLAHPPATPVCRSRSSRRGFRSFNSIRFRRSTRYAPTSPSVPRIVETVNQIQLMAV